MFPACCNHFATWTGLALIWEPQSGRPGPEAKRPEDVVRRPVQPVARVLSVLKIPRTFVRPNRTLVPTPGLVQGRLPLRRRSPGHLRPGGDGRTLDQTNFPWSSHALRPPCRGTDPDAVRRFTAPWRARPQATLLHSQEVRTRGCAPLFFDPSRGRAFTGGKRERGDGSPGGLHSGCAHHASRAAGLSSATSRIQSANGGCIPRAVNGCKVDCPLRHAGADWKRPRASRKGTFHCWRGCRRGGQKSRVWCGLVRVAELRPAHAVRGGCFPGVWVGSGTRLGGRARLSAGRPSRRCRSSRALLQRRAGRMGVSQRGVSGVIRR